MKYLGFTVKTLVLSVVTLLYVLLAVHFFYSYFVRVIGPTVGSHSVSESEAGHFVSKPCHRSGGSTCDINCGVISLEDTDAEISRMVKGFPMEINGYTYPTGCSSDPVAIPAEDFIVAKLADWLYFLALTAGYVFVVKTALRKHASKS